MEYNLKFLSIAAALALFTLPVQAQPVMKLCTGSEAGNYTKVGYHLAKQLGSSVKIEVVSPTEGSIDNLNRVSEGQCDAAITQKDALISFKEFYPKAQLTVRRMVELYPEYVHFICNKDKFSGTVTSLKGRKDVKLAIGEPGSGPNSTWKTIVELDPKYKEVPTSNIGGDEALIEVEEGRASCMIWVSGQNSRLIKDANNSNKGKLFLADFDDKQFSRLVVEETPVYEKAELPKSGNYSKLTGWSKPDTISTQATIVVSNKWYEANKSRFGALARDFRQAQPGVVQLLEKK